VYAYFKLFNSIKDEHEIQLARLELESLVGPIELVRNFADELRVKPLKALIDICQVPPREDESDEIRFQDYLTHEVAYGKVQGFISQGISSTSIQKMVRRLAYTREIYIVAERKSWKRFLKTVFPSGTVGKNCQIFSENGIVAVRVITNQYFLERCAYVLKVTPSLARSKITFFANRMFDNLIRFVYRIPASGKARVGKRFLDYLAERAEPSLYLSHGLHPYKGKFHPKMTRAIINIVNPDDKGTLMDNFAGSGTLLVEASMMGFDSYGVEINPMSVLIANGKCAIMKVDPERLDEAITKFLTHLDSELKLMHQQLCGQTTLRTMSYRPDDQILQEVKSVALFVHEDFAPNHVLEEIIVARLIIESLFAGDINDILMLGLAIAISGLKRKKNKKFLDRIRFIMEDIYRRCYLFNYLKAIIPLEIGSGVSFLANTANFGQVTEIDGVQGNVNSPPYSTALDYIKNDIDQLALLGFVRTPEELCRLEENMGGNPRAKYDNAEMQARISENPEGLPEYAMNLIRLLEHYGRRNHAYRLYNFFQLIKRSLAEQMRVLEHGSKIATVIGNNHFKLTDQIEVITSDGIMVEDKTYPIKVQDLSNNLKPIEMVPIKGKEIISRYHSKLPVKVSLSSDSSNSSQNGVYVEVENERVVLLLGMMLGFKPHIVINRHLEKTLRGNIRYESIVIMEKP